MAKKMRFDRKLGLLLLSVWLILSGLASLAGFSFNGMSAVMGVLAIGAGLLLLIDR